MHRAEREVHLSEQHGTSGQDIEYWGVVVQARTTATLHVIDASGGERVLRSSAWRARWSSADLLCVRCCCTLPQAILAACRARQPLERCTDRKLMLRPAKGGATRTATGARVTRRPALRRRARGARPKAAMS